jgi:hypothetical protein
MWRDAVKFLRDTVTSGVDGTQSVAQIAMCEACDGMEWCVFQLEGQTHVHLQCTRCGASYCPQGTCPH